MDGRHEIALQRAIEKIEASQISDYVEEIYLYGSLATGKARWDSDVDIFVVLSENEKGNSQLKKEIIKLKGTISGDELADPEVDLKITYGQSWKKSESLFYRSILDEGELLWKRI